MDKDAKKITLIFEAKSDIGLVRTENQDSFGKFPEDNTDLYLPKGQLFIVADGMGGHKGGREASSIAVRVVNQEYFNSPYDDSVALKGAIETANDTIFKKAEVSAEFGRMGTTCSVLLLKNERGIIGHVGDSRIYRIENNSIEQLTSDHTKVQEMLKEGILTPEEAVNYPSKSVLARALGVDEKVRVDIIDDLVLKSGQSFVLCSDGLAKVNQDEILNIVVNNSPGDACKKLVDMANDRGGKDNVTVIVIKIDPGDAAEISTRISKPEPKPVKKAAVKTSKKGKRWIGIAVILFIILLLAFQYKDSILSSLFGGGNGSNLKNDSTISQQAQNLDNSDTSEKELINKADRMLKRGDYEHALAIYRGILNNEPMHQAALKGVNEITSAYIAKADDLMNQKDFNEALKYYKKVQEIQPEDERVKSLIRLCISQIGYQESGTDSASYKSAPEDVMPAAGAYITATRFDLPEWSYPGINKNEFSIKSFQLTFTNTLSEKFIIYNKDLVDVTIRVNTETDNQSSTLGLIIGYASPTDYYIFKHRNGGDYILQKIKGNDIEQLLRISNDDSDNSGRNLLKIQYSDNLISIYDANGLLSSYKSSFGISGKAGLYVDKNSSAKFQNIFLSGRKKLE
jgi:serine/threonine protein phosphatase PrpC/tetratricopeptide (TPR) repeat protein